MAYLSLDDYSRSITVSNLTEILTQALTGSGLTITQIRNNAEAWAQSEISGFLSMQYNVAAEFTLDSSNSGRNAFIIQAMVDMALYRIFFTVNPRDIPEHRKGAFDEAVAKMKAAMNGEFHIGVAKLPTTATGGRRRIEYYSNRKFTSKQYDDPNFLNPEQSTS